MAQPNTTRRALLGAATTALAYAGGAAIVGGAAVVASEAKGAAPGVSPALLKLIADHARHDAAVDRWYEAVWNPEVEKHHAALDAATARYQLEVEVERGNSLHGFGGSAFTLSTARKQDVGRCRGIVSIPRDRQSQDENWQVVYRAARRIVAAKKREERAHAAINREHDKLRLREQEHAYWEPINAATKAIKAFPVAGLADFAAKLDFLDRIDIREGDAAELFDIVRADAARLAGEAQA